LKRGGIVNSRSNPLAGRQGFSKQDILWALGTWSAILSLSPVIAFYLLLVN
jgi:hypothetical protein